VKFASLSSRCPDPNLSATRRVDPFYGRLWVDTSGGIAASWRSRQSAEDEELAGLGAMTATESRWSRDEALELVLGSNRRRHLAVLAAIMHWRTATAEQLASIVGMRSLRGRVSPSLDLLWAAGLIQKGTLVSSHRLPSIYRPSRGRIPVEWLNHLTYEEWVGVTSGRATEWGSQYDRHNILATELGLRIAEWHDVVAVFGEALGSTVTMLGEDPTTSRSQKMSDAVFVRPDGMIFAVEMTATTADGFRSKTDSWAAVLANDPNRRIAVVFVDIAQRGSAGTSKVLRKHVLRSATGSMDAQLADVHERMFITSWRSWFPSPGDASEQFLGLRAIRPTGATGDPDAESRWEDVSLIDPFSLAPIDDAGVGRALRRNVSAIWGAPWWLRTEPPPDFDGILAERAWRTPQAPAA
jgi:hypothetical protein